MYNMTGEKPNKLKYVENFLFQLSIKDNEIFEKEMRDHGNFVKSQICRRASWVPYIESICFNIEKARRNQNKNSFYENWKEIYRRCLF